MTARASGFVGGISGALGLKHLGYGACLPLALVLASLAAALRTDTGEHYGAILRLGPSSRPQESHEQNHLPHRSARRRLGLSRR